MNSDGGPSTEGAKGAQEEDGEGDEEFAFTREGEGDLDALRPKMLNIGLTRLRWAVV